MMAVGIVAIVKSRKPGALLPLLLLGGGVAVVPGGGVQGIFRISGALFAVLVMLSMLPLVASLLAFLSSKRTPAQER